MSSGYFTHQNFESSQFLRSIKTDLISVFRKSVGIFELRFCATAFQVIAFINRDIVYSAVRCESINRSVS
jgi:hypothetical protein